MKKNIKKVLLAHCLLLIGSAVLAKLPPLSDEAKAKAAEAAAKTAWSGKVDGFQLCKAQDKAASHYKKTKLPATGSACVDPGPFVYPPAPSAVAPVPAASQTPVAIPAKKP